MNKNSQNKQFRIRCVPFHSFLRIVFALLKINGFANKSEFVVQPKSEVSGPMFSATISASRPDWRREVESNGGIEGRGQVVQIILSLYCIHC